MLEWIRALRSRHAKRTSNVRVTYLERVHDEQGITASCTRDNSVTLDVRSVHATYTTLSRTYNDR